jgi:type IV pilus assembly protein PilQ
MNQRSYTKNRRVVMNIRGRPFRDYGIINLLRLLLVVFAFAGLLAGCAGSGGETQETLNTIELPPQITDIDIQDNQVRITADKPFIYTIYNPGDPYKSVIELPGVNLGRFTEKIDARKAGISAVVPTQVDAPSFKAKLEVLLQEPSTATQEYANNVLNVQFKGNVPSPGTELRKAPVVESEAGTPGEGSASESKRRYPLRGIVAEGDDPASDRTPMMRRPSSGRSLLKATRITDISFSREDDAVKVIIEGDGSMTPNVFPIDDRLVIDIDDVELTAAIPSVVVSPVKGLRSGKHNGKMRLVFDLERDTSFDVTSIGDSIIVTLEGPGAMTTAGVSPQVFEEQAFEEKAFEEEEEAFPPGFTDTNVFGKFDADRCRSYLSGKERVSLDFQNQEIVPILRLFAKISGCNIFIHPDVRGSATMDFRDVPWNQALETMLNTFSLGHEVDDNIIRVAPLSVFARESEERAKAEAAKINSLPLVTRVFPVSYADVNTVQNAIRNANILSPRGSINVDKRTSTMLIKDVEAVYPEVEHLLSTLDKPTPQVIVEARIVESNTSASQDLGIQWGINAAGTNGLWSLGGLSGVPTTSPGAVTGGNYLVDFPSTSAGPLSGSGITFGILSPDRTVGLDLQLSALETTGDAKVISNPKILTVDNGEAKILQGKSIPTRKLTTEGTVSTEYKDVTLELIVTPHITPDGSIQMDLNITKEELDPSIPSVEGVPGTDKKEADTNIIIKDGETVVIGGLYKITESENETGVPFLMRLPVLGWLFKNYNTDTTTNELLIFVTPRIVEKP